jgi:hypothetical protein
MKFPVKKRKSASKKIVDEEGIITTIATNQVWRRNKFFGQSTEVSCSVYGMLRSRKCGGSRVFRDDTRRDLRPRFPKRECGIKHAVPRRAWKGCVPVRQTSDTRLIPKHHKTPNKKCPGGKSANKRCMIQESYVCDDDPRHQQ